MSDEKLLSITGFFKAVPMEEQGERIIYLEASNEKEDIQRETVLSKALDQGKDYFLKYGNFDIDHITRIGAKIGIPDYLSYEIGQPREVKVRDGSTWVKGVIYQGDGALINKANMFWDSITKQKPPQRWYPSISGAQPQKEIKTVNKRTKTYVTSLLWNSIGFSKTPVNDNVSQISTVPYDVFNKSYTYSTDVATYQGQDALLVQSLDKQLQSYFDPLAKAINLKQFSPTKPNMISWVVANYDVGVDVANYIVTEFLKTLVMRLSNNE